MTIVVNLAQIFDYCMFSYSLKSQKDAGSSEHDVVKEVQTRLRDTSPKWQKTSVPQCRGELSLMDVSTVVQAVIVYMKDHYPTTPDEFNFHAELKAACHWHWLDKTK